METHLKEIDIIIPVYNGYDDLKKCMASIFLYTDLDRHRVLLIDDKSPDDRIVPLLEEYKSKNENIIVIYNQKNLGFSSNVNKGMKYSDRDVILLNSDTIVTSGWVDKIVSCAYSREEIGTVTPLSNAATLCSVPVICQDNPLPKDVSVDDMGRIVEKHSLRKYPRITVAVGFCMFIKREVIDKVGYFDAETFEKGYGEENDFCNRAGQRGYIHVMCDDTFIYHKGTASFNTEEKKKLSEAHNEILIKRYPEQMRRNTQYCMDNPDQYVRDNLMPFIRLCNHRKNILYFVHSDFREEAGDNKGGTQFHVRDLVTLMKPRYNVFVMARDGEYLYLTVYHGEETESFRFRIGPAGVYQQFTDKKIEAVIENVINAFEISLIHVHHTFSLSSDIFYTAKKYSIPLIVTLHDYYYVCPTIKLMDKDGAFCPGKEVEDECCAKCLHTLKDYYEDADIIREWRAKNGEALELCDCVVTPSESAKQIVLKYYPGLESKMKVIGHGEDMEGTGRKKLSEKQAAGAHIQGAIDFCMDHPTEVNTISGWAYIEGVDSKETEVYLEFKYPDGRVQIEKTEQNKREDVAKQGARYLLSGFMFHASGMLFEEETVSVKILVKYGRTMYASKIRRKFKVSKSLVLDKKLTVGFLGAGTKEKGSGLILELLNNDKYNEIGFYLIGPIGDKRLEEIDKDNFVRLGAYDKEKLPSIIKNYHIDLIAILPVWAETFCYTLSEAVMCNVPVIGTDIGAVGERIKKENCGWVVEPDKAKQQIEELLLECTKDPKIILEKKAELKQTKIKSLDEMKEDYISLYEELFSDEIEYGKHSNLKIYQAYCGVRRSGGSLTEADILNIRFRSRVKRKVKSVLNEIRKK